MGIGNSEKFQFAPLPMGLYINMKKIYIITFASSFIVGVIIFSFLIHCSRMSGESMLPNLKPNDMIYYIKTDKINVTDIIVYKNSQGTKTIHRVVGVYDNNYITKGDNNDFIDWEENITKENILGKMVFRIPFGSIFN